MPSPDAIAASVSLHPVVLVVGARLHVHAADVWRVLDKFAPSVLLSGSAGGADAAAVAWAERQECAVVGMPRQFHALGKSAEHVKHRALLARLRELAGRHPCLVLAFPGGAECERMIRAASAAGVTVIRFSGWSS